MTEALVTVAAKWTEDQGGKMEVMKIRCADNNNVSIENDIIREVDKFVYLSCELRKDGDIRSEISIRTGMSSAAFKGLSRIWTKNCISLKTKLMTFSSIVISVSTYGSVS